MITKFFSVVGGLALARALVLGGNERMSHEDMLNIANEMEGHPDNVAAAIYGSANIAWQESQRGQVVAQSLRVDVDPRIGALAFVPATELSTSNSCGNSFWVLNNLAFNNWRRTSGLEAVHHRKLC